MGMGIAEVIPGVSGGTIAFITGIYSELINSIKSFDLELMRKIFKGQFKQAAERINFSFLFFLFLGMLFGLLAGIFGISHMLENYPEILWSVFFALILLSVPIMLKQVNHFNLLNIFAFLISIFIAFVITSLSPVEASNSMFYIFIGGLIAIVALVLPGISGSFILLLLGLYTLIIPTLRHFLIEPNFDDFKIITVFALGCLTGLALFARLVSKAFEKYNDLTIMVMSGFMCGSLNKIWPWRNPEIILDKESGNFRNLGEENLDFNALTPDSFKILTESNVLPNDYFSDPHTSAVLISFLLTAVIMFTISRFMKDV